MSSEWIGLDQILVQQEVDEAELAAIAFLARYSGRTLEAYRQDLRFFFSWTASIGLEVLAATRPHIELFRHHMEQRDLAASTIDRRLATVCGLYRFAHIDGRVCSNPAQYVRRPKVYPSQGHGMDRTELGRFLFAAEQLGHQRAAGERGVRDGYWRPRLRPRPPHPPDSRQGPQAGSDPARATHRSNRRPCDR